MEAHLQIGLAEENLALAMALGAAALRGVITSGLVPGHSEITTPDGQVRQVATPLQLGGNTDLIRCMNNQVRGSFALSVINTQQVLSTFYAGSPLEEQDEELKAIRCVFHLLSQALGKDMMSPVWSCQPEYRQKFEVKNIGFFLDAVDLDGEGVFWSHFGGLEGYLSLLRVCRQKVLDTAPSRPVVESLPTNAQPSELFQNAREVAPVAVALSNPPEVASQPVATLEPPEQSLPFLDAPEDSVAGFVAARGIVAEDAMIIAKDLYDNYLAWCEAQAEEPFSQRSFGMRLTELGFERKRRGRGKHWWVGLELASV